MPTNDGTLLAIERQRMILDILQREGVVRNTELQELLNVSSATIRSDLRELESSGALEIVWGGAVAKRSPIQPQRLISERSTLNSEQKRRIGARAAQLVQTGQTIMVDAGTTTIELIKHLPPDVEFLRIVTSALNVAFAATHIPGVELIVTGGTLQRATNSLYGSQVIKSLETINADWAFIACDGFTLDYGVTTSNLFEAEVKQIMAQNGEQTVLIADSSKFGKKLFAKIVPLNQINLLITDKDLGDTDTQAIEAVGVEVLRV